MGRPPLRATRRLRKLRRPPPPFPFLPPLLLPLPLLVTLPLPSPRLAVATTRFSFRRYRRRILEQPRPTVAMTRPAASQMRFTVSIFPSFLQRAWSKFACELYCWAVRALVRLGRLIIKAVNCGGTVPFTIEGKTKETEEIIRFSSRRKWWLWRRRLR